MEWVTYEEAMNTFEPSVLLEIDKPTISEKDATATISSITGGDEDEFEVEYHIENRPLSIEVAIRIAENIARDKGINLLGVKIDPDRR